MNPLPDRTVVRIVVGGLAATLLVCVVGIMVLIAIGKDPKDILPIATGALGGLAGVLARTSSEQSAEPIPVTPVAPPEPMPLPDPVDGGGDESGGVATRRPRKQMTTSPRGRR